MLKQLKELMEQPAAAGESSDKERLILEHLPQIKYIAHRIHSRVPKDLELDDLMGAGIMGLVDAADKFVPGKGVRFKTYAQVRIQGAILDSLRALDWAPRKLRQKSRELEAAIHRLRQRDHRPASDQEIADEMKISLQDFYELLRNLKGVNLGLFRQIPQNSQDDPQDGEVRFYPFAPMPNPPHVYHRQGLESQLAAALRRLPQRELEVMSLYYGEELTLREIGEVFGVSESRVCQIHARAVARLRSSLLGAGEA